MYMSNVKNNVNIQMIVSITIIIHTMIFDSDERFVLMIYKYFCLSVSKDVGLLKEG